jgi:hypothetical protein
MRKAIQHGNHGLTPDPTKLERKISVANSEEKQPPERMLLESSAE